MGEMADELIDLIFGCDYDEMPPPTCRYCGRGHGLSWQKVGNGWRLFEDRAHGPLRRHERNRGLTPAKIVSNFDDLT